MGRGNQWLLKCIESELPKDKFSDQSLNPKWLTFKTYTY